MRRSHSKEVELATTNQPLRPINPMKNLEKIFCLSGSRRNTETIPEAELREIVNGLYRSGELDDENYLEWENENNETPLEIAIKAGNTVMVKTLIENGDVQTDAFQIACQKGNKEIVELLLDCNAHASMDVHEQSTCILICAKQGYIRLLRMLHKAGFPLTNVDKFTTLKPAKGANVSPLWNGRTDGSPVHVAAGNGHHQIMEYLIQQDMEIESGDSCGRKPLHHAVQGGLRCLRSLLEACVDIEAADKDGHSSLFLAASFGNLRAVKLLVNFGADLDTQNDEGVSALVAAASSNQDRIVKYLLDEGAIFLGVLPRTLKPQTEPPVPNRRMKKTMFEKVQEANYATIKTLEDNGNILPAARIKLHIGISPEIVMSEAVQRGHRHVVKLLTELDSLQNAAVQALSSSLLQEHASIILSYAYPKRLSQKVLLSALSHSVVEPTC